MQKISLKSLCVLLPLFVALLAFSSCSNKDKDPKPDTSEASIVGVWDAYKIVYKYGSEPEGTELYDSGAIMYDFRSDGKFIVLGSETDHDEGTYELLGNDKIKFTDDDGPFIIDIMELTAKKLTLKYSFVIEGVNYTSTTYFNRK